MTPQFHWNQNGVDLDACTPNRWTWCNGCDWCLARVHQWRNSLPGLMSWFSSVWTSWHLAAAITCSFGEQGAVCQKILGFGRYLVAKWTFEILKLKLYKMQNLALLLAKFTCLNCKRRILNLVGKCSVVSTSRVFPHFNPTVKKINYKSLYPGKATQKKRGDEHNLPI